MRHSLSDLLLATIGSGRSIKSFHKILNNREYQRYKKESVSVALSRLHNNKYVRHSTQGWQLTQKGHLRSKNPLGYIASPFTDNAPAMTIVSFDIPESDRTLRNWLRNQLKIFDYKMLQKSLWLGPGPLPKEFLDRLKKLRIREHIKIFSRVQKTS